jgi:hypothetical protein
MNMRGKDMIRKIVMAAILAGSTAASNVALAEPLNISGEGRTAISQNISQTREEALRLAKRAAIIAAVNKINGPSASNDPKVLEAIEKMVIQVGDDKISDQKNSRDSANNFVTRVTLIMDESEFRTLLQDQGIASTVNRNFPILVVMNEFFTTQTDNHSQKPMRELIEYSHDKTATSDASLSAAESSSSSAKGASRESSASSSDFANGNSSSGHSSAGYSGVYGGAGYSSGGRSASSASGSAAAKSKSSGEFSNEAADASRIDTKSFDQKKDIVNYKKLVEYLPKNLGPEKKSYTYEAILREATKYDLAMLDSAVFTSNYFNGKQMTMEEMENSGELGRYVAAAREQKARYFMTGTSVIIDNGASKTVSGFECDGLVNLKAYSTKGMGSVIAADSRSESATGNSPDQCRVNVANKLALFVGKTVEHSIKNYWRQREVSGMEYNIKLVSLLGTLSDDTKDAFAEAIESISGIQGKVIDQKNTRSEYEVSVTYKGDKSVARSIGAALRKNPSFAKVGRKGDDADLTFCLESACP